MNLKELLLQIPFTAGKVAVTTNNDSDFGRSNLANGLYVQVSDELYGNTDTEENLTEYLTYKINEEEIPGFFMEWLNRDVVEMTAVLNMTDVRDYTDNRKWVQPPEPLLCIVLAGDATDADYFKELKGSWEGEHINFEKEWPFVTGMNKPSELEKFEDEDWPYHWYGCCSFDTYKKMLGIRNSDDYHLENFRDAIGHIAKFGLVRIQSWTVEDMEELCEGKSETEQKMYRYIKEVADAFDDTMQYMGFITYCLRYFFVY